MVSSLGPAGFVRGQTRARTISGVEAVGQGRDRSAQRSQILVAQADREIRSPKLQRESDLPDRGGLSAAELLAVLRQAVSSR
ncbi:hypothetical protein XH96_18680 [Bradyrhizobium sp. CCBAU 51765]|nr:hypothetical protein XH96_18680 [Bradyrhizobium sp. CCBAU 51765]